ncbi:hypothetical protein DFH07DRAFT_947940 [Mycena maculata]|uniref:MYND-type domain-containing protein n=1 Tax=Mycena maculata TaxID=230809 RepID=A0AAD7KG77_9AGAR|nr:hypothetical protein DFH07DRAFT_947940 [Mycena maculata]
MELEHTVHPDIKKYHKYYSTSPKDLREIRAQGKQACAVCGSIEYELRQCAKCKHASYCLKECQKADWPMHKFACSAADSGVNMTKIAQTLNASTFLNMQLQGAFIDAFGLLRDPCLDWPFAARVDIGVEPTGLMDFMRIYRGGPPAENREGMVQQAAQVWRSARESVTSAGLATSPVGLIVLSKASALVHIFPITVLPQMMDIMDIMRGVPTFLRVSSLTGISTMVPVDVSSLIVMINKHIRADDNNKLSLRTEMTPGDVQTIRDAASGNVLATCPADWPLVAPPPQLAATILKEKMARDSMYQVTITFK